MTTDTQAVVDDTKAQVTPDAAVSDARAPGDDLETLLNQYNEQTKPADPVSPPQVEAAQPKTAPIADDRVRRIEERFFNEDLDKAVGSIFDGLKVPSRAAKGWLDQMARENPKIGQAFLNQHSNPQEWKRFEKALAKEAAKEFKSEIDEDVTTDRMTVAAAMRGASTKAAPAEPAPKLGRMSNAELRNKVREDYGFDPGF